MKVKAIAATKIIDMDLYWEVGGDDSPEQLIMYAARVSNPNDQTSGKPGLLKYCVKHRHWSIFETASMTVEIITSRAIAAQILRHRSFHFQEYSQRYAAVQANEFVETRMQDTKNRQNSLENTDQEVDEWFQHAQRAIWDAATEVYTMALEKGIAKEQARFLLPLSTQTKMYMTGTVRDWIHYLTVRTDATAQKEHREIAEEIKKIFIEQFPTIASALEWH